MQLDVGITSGMELTQILELTQIAQEADLNRVWLGDDIMRSHDVFTVASIILLRIPRINLGIGITSSLIRNISTIARASITLGQVGENRSFMLGLGVGGLHDLASLGITVKNPKSMLSNAATLLKKIWKNQRVSFSSEGFVLEGYSIRHRSRSRVQLFFGVRGPTLLKLAGKIADGVIISGSKTYMKKAIGLVKDSVKKSQRPTRDFRIVIWAPTILTERQNDLNLIKRTVVFVLADTPSRVLGMSDLNVDEVERIKMAYQRRGIAKAAELVTEDLLKEAAIFGGSDEICDSFRSFSKSGAHEVVFGPPYGANPQRAMLKLAQTWSESS